MLSRPGEWTHEAMHNFFGLKNQTKRETATPEITNSAPSAANISVITSMPQDGCIHFMAYHEIDRHQFPNLEAPGMITIMDQIMKR
jgi:hypothetical protein